MPCILFVSDFFFPDRGGVEAHIYQLSQRLMELGCKIVVMTRFRGNRHGVRWMVNGLKVYHLPFFPVFIGTGLPSLFYYLPILRSIIHREDVDLIHFHGAASDMGLECLAVSRIMGYPTVFTDHSMFGFADAGGINLNKIFRAIVLPFLDRMICVSYANKENAQLRSGLPAEHIYVIPNAVESGNFQPDPARRPDISERINIVVISRLSPRKGIALLKNVVPIICLRYPKVHFIIGGDGPLRIDLEEMIERCNLHDQVTMLGSLSSHEVRNVLVQGHIFLNTSLTETFCIALLEAASCGLVCVSTNVGGVPEVLPDHLVILSNPEVSPLVEEVEWAISKVEENLPDAWEIHNEVRNMYTWLGVAKRVHKVYDSLLYDEDGKRIWPESKAEWRQEAWQKIYEHLGLVWGKLILLLASYFFLLWRVLEWLDPADKIPKALNLVKYRRISSIDA
eukprot:GEMP01034182.1.p1 GENE.GEMP01034182.1~~GEMP01034182.1.p1  ORF type:complete len:451 (+),score=89.51 GEMP01034182.1:43-1395(+)